MGYVVYTYVVYTLLYYSTIYPHLLWYCMKQSHQSINPSVQPLSVY